MKRTGVLFLIAAATIFLFQNCSQNFSSLEENLSSEALDSSSLLKNNLVSPANQSEAASLAYDIIIVAGQSNAVGSGMGAFSDDRSRDALILQLGRFADEKKIVQATDGLQHWDFPFNQTYAGLGMSFAREYAKNLSTNRRVLLIPVAKGGSSILQWSRDQTYYSDMINRVKYALSLNSQNRIVAFLWHQGETDILGVAARNSSLSTAAAYGTRLQTLIQSVRSDLAASGSFPVLTGGYVPGWNVEGSVNVSSTKSDFQNTIRSVLSTNPPAYFVSSAQLISNYESGASSEIAQNIHFSGASQILFGKRFFQVFQRKASDPVDIVPATPSAVINNLMLTVMGRTQAENNADSAGIAYWVGQYQAGVSEAQIKSYIMASDEYFVRRAYEIELRRKADAGGLSYYLGLLINKQMTRAQVTADLRAVCQSKVRGECAI
jgi:hypothetical protein